MRNFGALDERDILSIEPHGCSEGITLFQGIKSPDDGLALFGHQHHREGHFVPQLCCDEESVGQLRGVVNCRYMLLLGCTPDHDEVGIVAQIWQIVADRACLNMFSLKH